MNLYVENRFKNISAGNRVAEIVSEENNVVEEPVSERSLFFENMYEFEEFNNIMESSIQILEDNYETFENVLMKQFLSSANRSALLSESDSYEKESSEEIQEEIKDKVDNIISSTKESIKQQSLKFAKALDNYIEVDAETIKKYSVIVSTLLTDGTRKLDGFKGIANFSLPDSFSDESIDTLSNLQYLRQKVQSAMVDVGDSFDRFELKAKFNLLKDDIKKTESKDRELSSQIFKAQPYWVPSDKEIDTLLNHINISNDQAINNIAETTERLIEEYEESMKQLMSFLEETVKKDSSLFVAEQIKYIYQVASELSRFIIHKYSMYIDLCIKRISMYRKATICIGKYILGGPVKSESVLDFDVYVAGESSDAFVFSKFESVRY